MTRALTTFLVGAAIALFAAGCGSDSQSPSGSKDQSGAAAPRPLTARGGRAEREAPKGASPVLREIYRQFPAPRPDPDVRGSARAIEKGEARCRNKTPLEVKETFWNAARGKLSGEQKQMIGRIAQYEKSASSDASFVAGQLAADVYAATLPEATARFGYQGCIHSLARRLERELAPSK